MDNSLQFDCINTCLTNRRSESFFIWNDLSLRTDINEITQYRSIGKWNNFANFAPTTVAHPRRDVFLYFYYRQGGARVKNQNTQHRRT